MDINNSLSSRFPFYYELKIAFVAWLLSPYTKGSSLLYRKFVHPTLSSKEKVITGAQVLSGWSRSAMCLLQSLYHSFSLKGWELLILFLCHLIISFWLVFLFFVVVVFLNTGICSAHSHILTHLCALEKLGGKGIKIPFELLCT